MGRMMIFMLILNFSVLVLVISMELRKFAEMIKRTILISTPAHLEIPALNACVTPPVTGARVQNILTLMALHFQDAI